MLSVTKEGEEGEWEEKEEGEGEGEEEEKEEGEGEEEEDDDKNLLTPRFCEFNYFSEDKLWYEIMSCITCFLSLIHI